MFTRPDFSFWYGAKCYVLCRGNQLDSLDAEPIPRWEAIAILSETIEGPRGSEIRDAYAAHAVGIGNATDDSATIIRWLAQELRDTSSQFFGDMHLYLGRIDDSGDGRRSKQKQETPSAAQEIAREFRVRGLHSIIRQGKRIRISVSADLDDAEELSRYDIISPKDAEALLRAMAKDPTTPLGVRDLFQDAAKVTAPTSPPDPKKQLVLLSERRVYLQERKVTQAITPSQLRQAMARGAASVGNAGRQEIEDDTAVRELEIEVLTSSGLPIVHVAVTATMDDGSVFQAVSDEQGIAAFGEVPASMAGEITYDNPEDVVARTFAANIKAAVDQADASSVAGYLQGAVDFFAVDAAYQDAYGTALAEAIDGAFSAESEEGLALQFLLNLTGLSNSSKIILESVGT